MFLIGQYDSPFVRRVAIAMRLYGIAFEHRPWSTFGDADKIAPYNPLRRVPTLVLDDGEALIESAMILDHLDDLVGHVVGSASNEMGDESGEMGLRVGGKHDDGLPHHDRPCSDPHEPVLRKCRDLAKGRDESPGHLVETSSAKQAKRVEVQGSDPPSA
jgi:hypothetical protein